MAKPKDGGGGDDKAKAKPTKRKGRPFLWGLIFGVLIGVFLGWWFRPPDSFAIEDLKAATEKKVESGAESSREALADWAESLSKKLRD